MNCVRTAVLLLVVLVPGAWANTAAPVLTLDPVMTKGAPAAPVTIVEFSDYQ
jgi:hypothetical protein